MTTFDRRVLLAELNDVFFELAKRHLDLSREELQAGKRARQLAGSEVASAELTLSRYLPPLTLQVLHSVSTRCSPQEYNARVNNARPPTWTWCEVACLGGPMTAAALGVALEQVFLEKDFFGSRRRAERFTFEERCRASGVPHLLDLVDLSTDRRDASAPQWSGGPRKRLCEATTAAAAAVAVTSRALSSLAAWRFTGHLEAERAFRTSLASIKGSWRCTRSGLFCWQVYLDLQPVARIHFPPDEDGLFAFSAFFQNGDTFARYLGHIRVGCRLLRCSFPDSQALAGLVRGVRKHSVRRPRSVFRKDHVKTLVLALVKQNAISIARLVVVARFFMLRVSSELFPLQRAGHEGLQRRNGGWHSAVQICARTASIELSSRKNDPQGTVISRSCSCRSGCNDLLCGVCSLRAQIDERQASGSGPRDLVFDVSEARALRLIQQLAGELELPRFTWHSLRRGMAQDLIASGSSLASVLLAGGWRSSAVLRYLSRTELDSKMIFDALSDED
jgi:hypothetical protein